MFKTKEKKVNDYIIFIERNIKDFHIREQIIEKIRFFLHNGKVVFDEKNLYGKMNHNNVTDYLEIRYENYNIICNFTEEVIGKHVNITQTNLKGGNTKISKTNKFKRKTYNNHNNTEMCEEERIYNYHNRLIFESILHRKSSYDTFDKCDSNIIYNESKYLENFLELRKQWNINDNLKIKYQLFKNFIGGERDLEEKYLLYYQPLLDDDLIMEIEIDKKTYEDFMTSKITYIELINTVIPKELKKTNK